MCSRRIMCLFLHLNLCLPSARKRLYIMHSIFILPMRRKKKGHLLAQHSLGRLSTQANIKVITSPFQSSTRQNHDPANTCPSQIFLTLHISEVSQLEKFCHSQWQRWSFHWVCIMYVSFCFHLHWNTTRNRQSHRTQKFLCGLFNGFIISTKA